MSAIYLHMHLFGPAFLNFSSADALFSGATSRKKSEMTGIIRKVILTVWVVL